MNTFSFLTRSAAVSVLALSVAGLASAQVTTSSMRGQVTTEDGSAVSGATVTILHEPTGTVSVASTSATGQFNAGGLRVGGPYSVTVTGDGFTPIRAEGLTTSLGDPTSVNLVVAAADDTATMDTVVVTGSAIQVAQVATGPSSTYNLSTLENAPTMNRDIKDIVRLDPRVYVDEGFNDAINCAGANPRYNSLTVDGVRLNDGFGLNSNGYPTERIPFSYDAIEQVSVELAPFDVNYGSFTACNINAVTKSGSNEIHGGAFFDYTSDSLTGDSVAGSPRDLGDFDEKRYGANVSFPIIPDTLFGFVAYEKFEGANIFGMQPSDVGLSDALYQSVIDTAVNQYGYIAGGLPGSMPVEDEKIFAKLDWNINNNHRAAFTYTYNDGFNFSPSDSGSTRISDGNHYYERGAELNSYTGSLISDWTDNFSTELSVSKLELENRQIPIGGLDNFGEVQVRVAQDLGSGTTTIYLGADDSRHANQLAYDLWNYKAAANYAYGDHVFTAGYEREDYSVFNLFIQEVQGEWLFSSPADFAAGDFADFRYENAAGSNDQNDGAANFEYGINTFYIQDAWQVNDQLNITAGLRYEEYVSDDKPPLNANFLANYGFGNDANMDGRDLLQPRFGFNYEHSDRLSLHGGFGLFSGGNPNVWISNNYSNNGVTLFECRNRGRTSDCVGDGTLTNINDFTYPGTGNPFIEVPQEMIDAVAAANGQGAVNALDPDFEIPSEWKFAIGADFYVDTNTALLGDLHFMADFLYSKTNEAAIVVPLQYTLADIGPDGRPLYSGGTNDFLLTNAEDKGRARILSLSADQSYENGISWALGYAYTDATDVNPMTSSVAFSNYSNYTTYDPVNPVAATSDYVVPHRFTLRLDYENEYFGDYASRFSLFGSTNEGAPYSYTMSAGGAFEPLGFFNSFDRQLAYIPSGANDPAISPLSDAAAVASLVSYVAGNDDLSDYTGGIAPRNVAFDDWFTKFDLKISQELPGFRPDDRTEAFLVVENLGNLLNDEWGVLYQHGFPGAATLYTIDGLDAEGRYIIDGFDSGADRTFASTGASLWQVHFGVKYKF